MEAVATILNFWSAKFYIILTLNKKEGNDQESIQLLNTFRSKTPKGKKEALKVKAPQSKHCKQKAKRTVSSWNNGQTAIQNKNFTKKYMQIDRYERIVRHSRIIALERSVKILLGVGGWGNGA